jgi:hypothetical protein
MRALALIAIAGGMFAVVACAAPAPPNDLPATSSCEPGADCTSTAKEHKTPNSNAALPPAPAPSAAPTTAPTAKPPTGSHDAGADSAAPPVTTHNCKDLSGCCSSLTDTVERLACLGVAIAGKEIACQVELAVCNAGGVGALGLGGNGGNGGSAPECSDLSTCCDQMDSEGYPDDAYDCRGHLSGDNAGVCSSWLTEYRDLNWCN